jgi:hypothetical protein
VFVNCPFDAKYEPLFDAILFTIMDCGFKARCALEIENSAQTRIEKIGDIIGECRYAIHDLSRTEIDRKTRLPRFNMPLELGIFLGAIRFGDRSDSAKSCIIFDTDRYRYQKFISDIAGQDIRGHDNQVERIIKSARDWLHSHSSRVAIPGSTKIYQRYNQFRRKLPAMCRSLHWSPRTLTFRERTHLMNEWIRLAPLG